MSKICLTFLLCIVCVSCHFRSDSTNAKEAAGEVVLIFQNCPPDINILRFPNGISCSSVYDIHYMDSAMVSSDVILRKAPDSDTITIHTNNDLLELRHNFGLAPALYLFHKGDSVLFTYKENIPYITILNRKTTYHESNYPFFYKKEVIKNKLPAIGYFDYFVFLMLCEGKIDKKTLISKPVEEWIDKYKIKDKVVEEWVHEYKIIDSLHNQNLLSDDASDYRRNILVSQINSTCAKDSAFLQYPEIKKILADTVFFAVNNDSLLQFFFYQSYLQSKIDNYTKGIKNIRRGNEGGGSNNPNYIARFDTISNLDFISAKAKRYFLMRELKQIFIDEDRDEIKKYGGKYISITGDSPFVSKLLAENKMDFNKTDQLLLIDGNSKQTNLHDVLEKNRGKVIYLDFWASWCGPCKRSMPDAKLLREEYKDKDIVFIYLAFKDEEKAWKADEQKFEVNYLSESYLITNSKTSQTIIDLKVQTVPRYLLFNKKGELVYQNAPGPHGKEIRKSLDKLLKEE